MLLYDLCNHSSYSFNFEKWFSNFDINSDLIKSWRETLLQAYAAYTNTILNFVEIDFFQYPLNLGDECLLLHLNIKYITNIVYNAQSMFTIKLSEISTDVQSRFIYSPTKTYNQNHISSEHPIIFCPFPSCFGIKLITIDGNHRITAKKANNVPSVNAVCYIPSSQMDFLTEFEFQLYSFIKFLCFD